MPFGQVSKENHLSAHAALALVQALFGTLPVVAKYTLVKLSPLSLVGLRVGITALILLLVQSARKRIFLQYGRDYIALAALSLFGVTLNQILFIGGLSLTKAVNTSLLAVTIPIFTLIFSTLTGNEQITRRKVLGILLSITGVVLIIDPRKASFSSETTAGDILIVLNSICYAIYVSLSKKIITRNGPFRSMMWLFIFSSLVCVPLGYFSFSSMPENNVTPEIWLIVIYIAVAATAGAYLLNAFALSKVDPSIVASYIYLQPLVGLLLGVLFLGESVGLLFIMAALAIFAGLYLACFSKKKEDLEDLSVSTAPHY